VLCWFGKLDSISKTRLLSHTVLIFMAVNCGIWHTWILQLFCEMIMVRDGLWCLTDHNFSSDDVADIIVLLLSFCTSFLHVCHRHYVSLCPAMLPLGIQFKQCPFISNHPQRPDCFSGNWKRSKDSWSRVLVYLVYAFNIK